MYKSSEIHCGMTKFTIQFKEANENRIFLRRNKLYTFFFNIPHFNEDIFLLHKRRRPKMSEFRVFGICVGSIICIFTRAQILLPQNMILYFFYTNLIFIHFQFN